MSLPVGRAFKLFLLSKINKTVNKLFTHKYLLYTNVGISLSLSGIGDIIEQNYEILTDKIPKWDIERTRNMTLSGTTVGIVCHYWYKYLDHRIPGYTLRIVTKKVLIDQFIGSPICILTFFATMALLEQSTKDDFLKELKEKMWKLYVAEWMIWPPCQFLNFYVLSTKYRVLFDNLVSLGFDIYTSHVKFCNTKNQKIDDIC